MGEVDITHIVFKYILFLGVKRSQCCHVVIDTIMHVCTAVFDTFQPLSCDVLASFIHKLNRTTCGLDPFPTKLLMSHFVSRLVIFQHLASRNHFPFD